MTNKSSEKYVQNLTTDLYYSLLDKYMQLQAKNKLLISNYTKAKSELSSFLQENTEDIDKVIEIHNKRLDRIIGVLFKHRCNRIVIEEIEALKVDKDLKIEI